RLSGHWRGQWKPAAAAIVETSSSGRRSATANQRDIYIIVADGFGRPDTLREYYGLDLQGFTDFLHDRGFYVADHARSNYSQTLLSFSSLLNMTYLDPLGTVMGRNSTNWLPLVDLIQRNALMRLAKQAGYQVVAIGADYGPTKRFQQAD